MAKDCFGRATKRDTLAKTKNKQLFLSIKKSEWLKFFEIYIEFLSFFLNESNRSGRSIQKKKFFDKKMRKIWRKITRKKCVVSFSIAGASQSKLPKGRFWINLNFVRKEERAFVFMFAKHRSLFWSLPKKYLSMLLFFLAQSVWKVSKKFCRNFFIFEKKMLSNQNSCKDDIFWN